MEPNLDRFAWKGPNETSYITRPLTESHRYGVKVLLLLPECEVCGQEVHPAFLREWNEKEVCKYCLEELHEV